MQVKGTCDFPNCNREFWAKDQGMLKRVIGYHKRREHGIQGMSSTPEGRRQSARERHWRLAGFTESQIAKKRAEWEAKHGPDSAWSVTHKGTDREMQTVKRKINNPAIPMSLNECPLCHARFYYTKDTKAE